MGAVGIRFAPCAHLDLQRNPCEKIVFRCLSVKDTKINNLPHFFLDANVLCAVNDESFLQCNRRNQTPKKSARAFQTGGPRSNASHNISWLTSSIALEWRPNPITGCTVFIIFFVVVMDQQSRCPDAKAENKSRWPHD